MSHYRVLGVPRGATRAEVRAAYVAAARDAHPDLHRQATAADRSAAVDRMCEINEAWRVLGDPARRRVYDQHRVAAAAGASSTSAGRAPSSPAPPKPPVHDPDQRPDRVPGRAPTGGQGNPVILLPAALMALAALQFVAGLLLAVPGLLASGAVTFAVSIAAFAAAPLVILATSRSGRRSALG